MGNIDELNPHKSSVGISIIVKTMKGSWGETVNICIRGWLGVW